MKKLLLLAAVLALQAGNLPGSELDNIQKFPAKVEVLNMKPTKLKVGDAKDAWARIPEQLANRKATIFKTVGGVNGVADIEVMQEG